VLSHSRREAVVWSERADQLGWLAVHNAGLRRVGGVPAVLRIDNLKTAIVRGAGPWGEINESYRTYARSVGFHIDATRPRAPEEKGKVERRILGHRVGFDPSAKDWESVAALQAWTDAEVEKSARRRTCPATGESVFASWEAERRCLAPLPILPEPFDVAVQRRVAIDSTVRFDGRTYSVPFAYAHQEVEVHGCAAVVQIWAGGRVVAEHPRGTAARNVFDPAHSRRSCWRATSAGCAPRCGSRDCPPGRRSRASTSPSSRASSAAGSRRSPPVRGSASARAC
jgi:hypothetical protein